MTVLENVQSIISKTLNLNPEEIKLESNLADDLGADSIDAVEIVMDLEETFNITLSDEQTENIKTVADLVNYIEQTIK